MSERDNTPATQLHSEGSTGPLFFTDSIKQVPHAPTPEMLAAAMKADQDGMPATMKTIWMVMWGAYQPPQQADMANESLISKPSTQRIATFGKAEYAAHEEAQRHSETPSPSPRERGCHANS